MSAADGVATFAGGAAVGFVWTGDPTVAMGIMGELLPPEVFVPGVGPPPGLGAPAAGILVGPPPPPAAGVAGGTVELVPGAGAPSVGLVPPAEPPEGELFPPAPRGVGAGRVVALPVLGVTGNAVATDMAGGVPTGATVALGPEGAAVGSGIGGGLGVTLGPMIDDVLVGRADNVLVEPMAGVDVALAGAAIGVTATPVAVCKTFVAAGVEVGGSGDGAGVGVCNGLTGVKVAPDVVAVVVGADDVFVATGVVAVVVVPGRVFVGPGVAAAAVAVEPGVDVGAVVIVAGSVPVGAMGVRVARAVDVAGIVALVVAVGDATGEADDAGPVGLEPGVAELEDEGTAVAAPGCVVTTVGAGANVFVTAGSVDVRDAVAAALGVGVTSGVGAALLGLAMFES